MSYKFEKGKDLIIESVQEKILQNLQGEQAKLCAEFAKQFYSTVSLEDLLDWNIDDLFGAIVNFWNLIRKREPNEIKIRIYNPDFERYGWQTTHTVVEIICKDMPFLVDSIRLVVNRMGLQAHLIIHMGGIWLKRDENDEIVQIYEKSETFPKGVTVDAPIFLEIDRQTDPHILDELYKNFQKVLEDNRKVVEDWSPMREKVSEIIDELSKSPVNLDKEEVAEAINFLTWIKDHHFTFLGVRDYTLVTKDKEKVLQSIPETGLGVLRQEASQSSTRSLSTMTVEARELTLSPKVLVLSKTNTLASVHRDAYTDYIGVKRFNEKGEVIGERRIIGLYTSAAYNTNPKHIPLLRHKVATIMKKSSLNPRSHAGKVLLNILATLPRDDLIQGTEEELLEIALGIFHLQERKRIRMFARMDIYHRFISCLVYVPRDRFNTELRQAIQTILKDSFNADEITFSTRFSESVLARIHFMIRLNPHDRLQADFNFKDIEKKIIEVGRSWTDDLQEYLYDEFGEEKGNQLFAKYKTAFPKDYMANFSARIAVADIKYIEILSDSLPLGMNFYHPLEEHSNHFRLKIYQHDIIIPLSEVLPIVENLGLRAITERPYQIKFHDGTVTWVNDFALNYPHEQEFVFEEIRERFQNAFTKIWFGEAENDGFNQLVLKACLDWREVSVLRMYAKYFRQMGFKFSQEYIISALNNNPLLATKLLNLFEISFNPDLDGKREDKKTVLTNSILKDLDAVDNLDEDRIIRQYVQAINATLRTNYYQYDANGKTKSYISIKLDSKKIAGMPKPYPMFEIFVYSAKMEGVHLRGGKVARGGLRWSDRKEDFRTEVLGLMKAQHVKNAIIVPSGAKGGFVVKQPLVTASREELQAQGIDCYKTFIRGLLDITDNYLNQEITKPQRVVCYDEDDPYLVVAADKGTATFSDIANQISLEYEFWLGDAFASGGSMGYDHKKMGITARGAWESVKQHCYALGIGEDEDITVVGIGDMSGDVFGNGMLLSKHIKLVAAFNHMHIFIDPNPDPLKSYKERERLFHLPRSMWSDYDKKLISKGGGVFNRSAKSISVSPEMKKLLNIKSTHIEPNELVKAILKAKVDLLWSAGIGTFIKSEAESSLEVGDRGNDAIRINGNQLRCRMVGEGGNLGFTQLARVEYALNSGRIYTDFIDNSAGVSCSDKEVNIKILLNMVVRQGDLTFKQRNTLLTEMTDDIAKIVLRENYLQTKAIDLIENQATRSMDLQSRYINELVKVGILDRELEFLPSEKELMERKLADKGLTSPEIAILLGYSKIHLKEEILKSEVPEDPALKQVLIEALPVQLKDKFAEQLQQHPLKREIIATRLSNLIVNEMGFTFIYRLQDETGAPVSAVVRAYAITRHLFDMDQIWGQIESLGNKITAKQQNELMRIYVRLLRRVSRWFLRSHRTGLDITQTIARYKAGVMELKKALPKMYGREDLAKYEESYNLYLKMGSTKFLAHELAISPGLFNAMDIIEIADEQKIKTNKAAEFYFGIGELLDLVWIRNQIIIFPTENHWEALSREALRDELDWQQRQLTACILCFDHKNSDFYDCYNNWKEKHLALIERWKHVVANLKATGTLNTTAFFVAIRELLDLTQTTIQEVKQLEKN